LFIPRATCLVRGVWLMVSTSSELRQLPCHSELEVLVSYALADAAEYGLRAGVSILLLSRGVVTVCFQLFGYFQFELSRFDCLPDASEGVPGARHETVDSELGSDLGFFYLLKRPMALINVPEKCVP
jgi:hypothetical protein